MVATLARDTGVYLCFVALVAVAFADVLRPGRGLFFRDHVLVFKPLWWSATEALGQGRWPLTAFGVGVDAPESSMNAAYYTPLSLLFAWPDFERAYAFFVASHVLLLACGAFVLARSLGKPRLGAATFAIVLAFSGPVISFENLVVGLQCMAWAPWVSWAFVRLIERPTAGRVAGLAVVGAFELQALLPEILIIQVIAASWACSQRRPSRAAVLCVVGAAGLAVALAAIDLGPQLEALAGSRRGAGFSAEERSGWMLQWGGLVEILVAPNFWAPVELVGFNVPSATGATVDPPYLVSLFMAPALVLAVAGVAARPRDSWILVTLFVVAVAMAVGTATPLHALVTSAPVLSSTRYAIKYLVAAVVVVAVLASRGVDALAHESRAGLVASALRVGLLVSVWSVVRSDDFGVWLSSVAAPLGSAGVVEAFRDGSIIALAREAMGTRVDLILSWSVASCAAAALAVWRGPRWSPLVVAVLALELACAARVGIVGADLERQRPMPGLVERVAGDRHRVLFALPPPVESTPGLSLFEGYVTQRGRYGINSYAHVRRWEPVDLDGTTPGLQQAAFASLDRRPWAEARRLLQRAGVRYVTSRRLIPGERPIEGGLGDDLVIYDLGDRPGHVWTSTRAVTAATERARLELAASTSPQVVVVEQGRAALEPSVERCAVGATWSVDQPTRAVGQVELGCAAVLVIREPWDPYWEATVAGQPAPTFACDLAMTCLSLAAGRHEVRIERVPATARWLPVTAAALVIVVVLSASVVLRVRRRQN